MVMDFKAMQNFKSKDMQIICLFFNKCSVKNFCMYIQTFFHWIRKNAYFRELRFYSDYQQLGSSYS